MPARAKQGQQQQLVDVGDRLGEVAADSAVRAIFGDWLPDRAAFLKMMERALDFAAIFDLCDLRGSCECYHGAARRSRTGGRRSGSCTGSSGTTRRGGRPEAVWGYFCPS